MKVIGFYYLIIFFIVTSGFVCSQKESGHAVFYANSNYSVDLYDTLAKLECKLYLHRSLKHLLENPIVEKHRHAFIDCEPVGCFRKLSFEYRDTVFLLVYFDKLKYNKWCKTDGFYEVEDFNYEIISRLCWSSDASKCVPIKRLNCE